VRLWTLATAALPNPEVELRLLSLLSPNERDRHARFRFARDRNGYLYAHALLHLTLSWQISGQVADPVFAEKIHGPWPNVFVYNDYGKPALPPDTGPRFNLSHTDGLAVCALSADLEIGVDVERADRDLRCDDLADRWLASEERAWLASYPAERRSEAFLRLWTLKEAYVKALGLGLSLPLSAFAIAIADDGQIELLRAPASRDDASIRWQFEQWRIGQYWLALALPMPAAAAPCQVILCHGEALLNAFLGHPGSGG
jgi:4'-phosphopantetheinyl transferase